MNRSSWLPRWGDVNGMIGLFLDNAAALMLLYTLLAAPGYRTDRFTASFVLTWLIPGTVAGVLVGGLLFAALARRLARRTGRADVTAMPVGLDSPSVFAMSFFVLLPALAEGRALFAQRDLEPLAYHELASVYAWHVGAVVLVMLGIFKAVAAPLGRVAFQWLPRAALLGSLAAVALVLIAFLPMARHVAAAPVIGLPVLAITFATLMSRRGTHDTIPGSVVALGVGFVIVLVSVFLDEWGGVRVVPLPESRLLDPGAVAPLPPEVWGGAWWEQVLASALDKLPMALPFALFTLVGGAECVESAAAAGDEYDPRGVLLVQGVASAAAGLLGGVVQTTPYFGHPAYKKMGAGWAYPVLGTVILALAGYFGWFANIFAWVPGAMLFPVIVFIGLRTIAHSYEATPPRDYGAMALAVVPVLAYVIVLSTDEIFAGRTPNASGATLLRALRCLGNGFILTSLLWAAALTAIMNGRPRGAMVILVLAAGCSLFGLIHSPLAGAPLAWPHHVWRLLAEDANPRLQYMSPFHWAAAYLLAAGVFLVDSLMPPKAPAAEATADSSTPANLSATSNAER